MAKNCNIEEVESVLSFQNRGFTLNPVGFLDRMDRGNMNQKAQLYLFLLLHKIKPRSRNSDLTIDMSCLLYWIMSGEEVYVAQIISHEIREVASSGKKLGTKPAAQLTFPGLIMGLCRRACVEIPDVVYMNITSVMDESYVVRYCSPRMIPRNQPQPHAMAPPLNRYNDQLACRYNWNYFDANRRSQAMIHKCLEKLYHH